MKQHVPALQLAQLSPVQAVVFQQFILHEQNLRHGTYTET